MLRSLLSKSVDLALWPVETAVVLPSWVTISVVLEVAKHVDLGL